MVEVRNTIPFLIDYFKKNSKGLRELASKISTKKVDLTHLRNALLIKLARDPAELNTQTISSRLKKLKPEEITGSQETLAKIKDELPESGIYRGVLEGLNKNLDYNGIAESVCTSLDQVFKVMRLVERKLQDENTSPVKEVSDKDWARLSPAEKQVLEKALTGFTNQEIAELTNYSEPAVVSHKSKALKKLGKTQDWLKESQRKVASLKMKEIEKEYGFSDKLLFFAFGAKPYENGAFTSLNTKRLEIMKRLQSAWTRIENPKDARAIKQRLEGFNIKDIAERLHYNPDSLSRRLERYKESLVKAVTTADEKVPAPGINQHKYRALTEMQKAVISKVVQGQDYEAIKAELNLENTAQVTTIVRSCRKALGIKTPAKLRSLITQAQACNKEKNPQEFRKRLFALIFPEGLKYPFTEQKKDEYEKKLEAIILEFLKKHEDGKYYNEMIKRVELGSDVEVARQLKTTRLKVKNHVKNTRRALNRDTTPFTEGKISLKSAWTVDSARKTAEAQQAYKERLVSRIFNGRTPPALDVSEKLFKKGLYDAAMIEINKLDDDRKALALAYAEGRDPADLAGVYNISKLAMNSRVMRVCERIRTGLQDFLLENSRSLLRDKKIDYALLYPDRKIPAGLKAHEVKKTLEKTFIPNLPEEQRNPHLDLYLHGVSVADIAKYYGHDPVKLAKSLNATCYWLKTKLDLCFAKYLPKEIDGLRFALLQEQQQVAIKKALEGMTNKEIQAKHSGLFQSTDSVIAALSSGLANFGLDIAWLRTKIPVPVKVELPEKDDREVRKGHYHWDWLQRMGADVLANYIGQGFEEELYQRVIQAVQNSKREQYKEAYLAYTNGYTASEIVGKLPKYAKRSTNWRIEAEYKGEVSRVQSGINKMSSFVRTNLPAIMRQLNKEFKARLGY